MIFFAWFFCLRRRLAASVMWCFFSWERSTKPFPIQSFHASTLSSSGSGLLTWFCSNSRSTAYKSINITDIWLHSFFSGNSRQISSEKPGHSAYTWTYSASTSSISSFWQQLFTRTTNCATISAGSWGFRSFKAISIALYSSLPLSGVRSSDEELAWLDEIISSIGLLVPVVLNVIRWASIFSVPQFIAAVTCGCWFAFASLFSTFFYSRNLLMFCLPWCLPWCLHNFSQ